MFARHGTLSGTPGTVATVTLDKDYAYVEVFNRSATAGQNLYFTLRGAAPSVDANNTYVVLNNSRYVLDDRHLVGIATGTVQLVSGTASLPYSVIAY